jgi:hypothetical protein
LAAAERHAAAGVTELALTFDGPAAANNIKMVMDATAGG